MSDIVVRSKPCYWIISFPSYGTFVFYGTEEEAKIVFEKKSTWENSVGILRKADSKIKEDWQIVNKETEAVRQDKAAGIKDLPYLPNQDGF